MAPQGAYRASLLVSGLVETDISGVGGLGAQIELQLCQLRQADQAGMGLISDASQKNIQQLILQIHNYF